MKIEKPPILNDAQVNKWLESRKLNTPYPYYGGVSSEKHKEAQRDADVEWYEQKIREIFEEIEKHRWFDTDSGSVFAISSAFWQTLKSKYTGEKK